MHMKRLGIATLLLGFVAGAAQADEYVIDGTDAGMHTSVQWRALHAGISPLWGRFNDISGHFTYDANNIASSTLEVRIGTGSLDSNHEARDIHLTSSDYIDAEAFPEATFVGKAFEEVDEGTVRITGDFTFRDTTKELTFDAIRTGEGRTIFGDYRVGFEAYTNIDAADFGINGMSPTRIDLILSIEGIRQ